MRSTEAEFGVGEQAESPAAALARVLEQQCRIGPANSGALIRIAGAERIELLAIHPPLADSTQPPAWLAAASRHLRGVTPGFRPTLLPPQDALSQPVAVVPVGGSDGVVHVWALYLLAGGADEPVLILQRLAMSAAGLRMTEAQGELARQAGEIERLHRTLTTLTGVASHDRFAAAAMALCNHIAAEWNCERVSLGIARGPYVRVAAMSHTEKLQAKSSLVQDLESVMEECFDQDIEVLVPSDAAEATLSRSAKDFVARQGPMAMCSIPIRRDAAPVGVLTLERPASAPFSLPEVASLRLLADAAAAQIWLAHRYRRWAGASLAAWVRSMLAGALGPRHAWAKLTGILLAAAALFFLLVPGTYRVRGDARVEAAERRVVAAPFQGFLREANAKVGDLVQSGSALASLDTTDLLLRLGALSAEQDGATREAALAQREQKDAEAQIARARARKAAAEIAYLQHQVEQAAVKSPVAGAIIAGELDRVVGAPVSIGDMLFEVAPLDSLYVEVFVEEDQIADIEVGAAGSLATLSRPDLKMPLVVERVDPIAQLREARNVFRVRAALRERPDWLRPGMEGTARFDAGSRSYPWIWTRRTVNWIRMQLWL